MARSPLTHGVRRFPLPPFHSFHPNSPPTKIQKQVPVVSGLVAGVGVSILQAAVKTQTAGSFNVWDLLFTAL